MPLYEELLELPNKFLSKIDLVFTDVLQGEQRSQTKKRTAPSLACRQSLSRMSPKIVHVGFWLHVWCGFVQMMRATFVVTVCYGLF